jgi:hypothetical protein
MAWIVGTSIAGALAYMFVGRANCTYCRDGWMSTVLAAEHTPGMAERSENGGVEDDMLARPPK